MSCSCHVWWGNISKDSGELILKLLLQYCISINIDEHNYQNHENKKNHIETQFYVIFIPIYTYVPDIAR